MLPVFLLAGSAAALAASASLSLLFRDDGDPGAPGVVSASGRGQGDGQEEGGEQRDPADTPARRRGRRRRKRLVLIAVASFCAAGLAVGFVRGAGCKLLGATPGRGRRRRGARAPPAWRDSGLPSKPLRDLVRYKEHQWFAEDLKVGLPVLV